MSTLPEAIVEAVAASPGMTDRELTNHLRGRGAMQQPINQSARALEKRGSLVRQKRPQDGLIGNYPSGSKVVADRKEVAAMPKGDVEALSEEEIKTLLNDWLISEGWETSVAWGKTPGIDIDATRGDERKVIEVKGPGSRPPMRVNYFLAILGETLQRMDDPKAEYIIALPDLPQYRGLWGRLPKLAKTRTGISLILVARSGDRELLE